MGDIPTLQSFESAYVQQQGVKCNNNIMSGPLCLMNFLVKLRKQIKIEKRHASDLRLPRHKRSIRHAREMELVDIYQALIERIEMSISDNNTLLAKYLIDASWMKGSLLHFMQQTECRLARNKTKLLLRVDKLTAQALDELLDRPQGNFDESSNELTWRIQVVARNLIGKGIPPDPALMTINDSDNLFIMLTKLQLSELYYARGMSNAFIRASTLCAGLESALKPLFVLRSGAKGAMETIALLRAGLKSLKSLLGCFGGDHVLTAAQRKVFANPGLVEELEFWLNVIYDVRTGGDFLTARRNHRYGNQNGMVVAYRDLEDDSSSMASGNTFVGVESNDSFRRVVDMIGNGLIYDLLWCVNAVVSITIQIIIDEQLRIVEEKRIAEALLKEQAVKAARSARQSNRPEQSHFRPVLDPQTQTQSSQSTKTVSHHNSNRTSTNYCIDDAGGVVNDEEEIDTSKMDWDSKTADQKISGAIHICETSLKLGNIIITRFSFMQHAAEKGNPALGNVPLLRAADEEAVGALDCAATFFSMCRIDKEAISILDAGLSLSYSRYHSIGIAMSTLQCLSKAAMCILQGGRGVDEPMTKEWMTGLGLGGYDDGSNKMQDNNNNNNNSEHGSSVMKVVFQEPDRTTLRGRLIHLLGSSVLKVMHMMHIYNMSLSIQHQGLMCIRMITREVFMKRDDIDGLIGMSEEDDFIEDDEAFEESLEQSNSVLGDNSTTASSGLGPGKKSTTPNKSKSRGTVGDNNSITSDMNSTVSGGSLSLSLLSAIDEPSPLIDDPSVPVHEIAHEWLADAYDEAFSDSARYLSLKSGNNKGIAKGPVIAPIVQQTLPRGHWVGIAELLKHVGDTHTSCIEVMEQMLLLVYHLGKSSYVVKIALMEAGFEVIINQIATTTAHNYYMTALCSLCIESLQMDQIVM